MPYSALHRGTRHRLCVAVTVEKRKESGGMDFHIERQGPSGSD